MWNWNNTFFLYNIVVMIMSGIVSAKLSNASVKTIKYLNEIVLAMSIALSAFVIGIMFGQSSYACLARKKLVDYTIYAQVALFVISLVIEGLLISIVAHSEFSTLSDVGGKDAGSYFVMMLVLNSLGIVGGALFVAYPHWRTLPSCPRSAVSV